MEYFCNVLLTTVAFYLFFYIGAMGAGDVKLLGVCAGYFSGEKVLCFAQKTESDGTVGCDIMDDRVNGKPLHQPVELLGG